jgi:predicted aspartyl protease
MAAPWPSRNGQADLAWLTLGSTPQLQMPPGRARIAAGIWGQIVMRKFGLAAALLIAAGFSAPALADDSCPPLTILTSVDMTIGNSGRVFVPAQVGGVQKHMLVDTGGFFSELTQPVVSELKLTPRHTGLSQIGVSGSSTEMAVGTSFVLGNLHADSMDFMVAPDETKFDRDLPGAGGILAPNLLTSYDADFDFANKKFNLISQKHCDGKVVYWPADTVAVVPIQMADRYHVQLPVELDGHRYTATLDTGASTTVVNLDNATRDFALKLGDADTPAEGTLTSSKTTTTYTHRFHSLSLEGIAVSNPLVVLLPDLVTNKMRHATDTVSNDTRIRNPNEDAGLSDMILGMDILHRFHLYIAYKEKKLYITPAAAPAQAAAPAPTPAAAAPAPAH